MRIRYISVVGLALLSACASPPAPTQADPSTRRPANAPLAAELEGCRNALHNSRIVEQEADRLAAAAMQTLQHWTADRRPPAAPASPATATPAAPANTVYTVHFAYGQSDLSLSAQEARTLLTAARKAPLVLIRGRTDGTRDDAGESRIARARANAARDFLVSSGVDPMRVRATFQPSGDAVADNATRLGREMNRRVEIEIYEVLPVSVQIPRTSMPSD